MEIQGFWTTLVGLVGTAIPLIILWIAIKQTPPHEFACTRCNRDIPVGSARCPACGAQALHTDQPL
jgi:rRNA maturation endonuclease Nob1